MSPVSILKRLMSVFINACRLLSALPSLSQFGEGRLSLVAMSFYALSLLFGQVYPGRVSNKLDEQFCLPYIFSTWWVKKMQKML